MDRHRRALGLVSVLVACAVGGCALSISAPQQNRKRNQLPVCDSGKGLVAIDALASIGFGIGGLAALSESEGLGAVALVGSALFIASALHGSGNADKCREAFVEYAKETTTVAPPIDEIVRRPRRPRRVEPDPDEEPDPPEPVSDLGDRKPSEVSNPPKVDPKPEPPKPPKRSADDWSQFWREVP